MHVVLAVVAILDSETVKIASEVVRRSRVEVPVGVDGVGARRGRAVGDEVAEALTDVLGLVCMVEALPAP